MKTVISYSPIYMHLQPQWINRSVWSRNVIPNYNVALHIFLMYLTKKLTKILLMLG